MNAQMTGKPSPVLTINRNRIERLGRILTEDFGITPEWFDRFWNDDVLWRNLDFHREGDWGLLLVNLHLPEETPSHSWAGEEGIHLVQILDEILALRHKLARMERRELRRRGMEVD